MVLQNQEAVTAATADVYQQITLKIGKAGWCVTPDFLSPLLVSQLRQETRQLWQKGQFRHAGVGRGDSFEINKKIRTDHVLWLDNASLSGAQKIYFTALESLRLAVNRNLFLGIADFEAHFAIYPKNSFYKKHLDQFKGVRSRTLSAILYLNKDWSEEHGGHLRMYTDANNPECFVDVVPQGGTLVTFLSAQFLHEVLPSTRQRKSITGWFKTRESH